MWLVRVQVDELFVGLDGLFQLGILDVPVGQDLVLAFGLDDQTLIEIKLGEAFEDVEPLRVQPLDLFQDGDGLGDKAVAGEVIRDLLVQLDRPLQLADTSVEVTDTVDDRGVAWSTA